MCEIPINDHDREYPNEYSEVERPFLQQLRLMGWDFVQGDIDYPQHTFREHFREVLLLPKLREAIRRINLDDAGNPWLDDATIDRAITELKRTERQGLLAKNEELTTKMIKGVSVDPPEGSGINHPITVKFIEYDPARTDQNEFLAINQFRVDFIGRPSFVIPDIILFVNGIPVGVVECKSPSVNEPMQAGVNQLLRYSNNRDEVEDDEGVPHLFDFNQLMISTWYFEARVSTLNGGFEHYQEWKDTSPVPNADVCAELGKESLQSQETLVAGMLRPAHLLDIIRNFILFTDDNGRRIKIVVPFTRPSTNCSLGRPARKPAVTTSAEA